MRNHGREHGFTFFMVCCGEHSFRNRDWIIRVQTEQRFDKAQFELINFVAPIHQPMQQGSRTRPGRWAKTSVGFTLDLAGIKEIAQIGMQQGQA